MAGRGTVAPPPPPPAAAAAARGRAATRAGSVPPLSWRLGGDRAQKRLGRTSHPPDPDGPSTKGHDRATGRARQHRGRPPRAASVRGSRWTRPPLPRERRQPLARTACLSRRATAGEAASALPGATMCWLPRCRPSRTGSAPPSATRERALGVARLRCSFAGARSRRSSAGSPSCPDPCPALPGCGPRRGPVRSCRGAAPDAAGTGGIPPGAGSRGRRRIDFAPRLPSSPSQARRADARQGPGRKP
jgi:hypothetical protein